MLLPIIPLSDLVKQEIGSSINTEAMRIPLWIKIFPHLSLNIVCLIIWGLTYPGWNYFIKIVLQADQTDLVQNLIEHLVPFYTFFTFVPILEGVFYGLGKTNLLALKSLIGNCIIGTLFTLFNLGILFQNNVFSIATIFGIGLISGFILTCLLFIIILRTYSNLASKVIT